MGIHQNNLCPSNERVGELQCPNCSKVNFDHELVELISQPTGFWAKSNPGKLILRWARISMRSSSMSATSWALGTLLDFVKISEVTPMDEPPVAIDHCHQWKSASKRAAKGSLSLDPNIDHPQVTSVCWRQVWFWYRTYKLLNWTQRAYARLFRSSFFENFCSCLF